MALGKLIRVTLIGGEIFFVAASFMVASPVSAKNGHGGSATHSAQAQKQFEFEVFSIRPHKPGSVPYDVQLTPDGYRATTDLGSAIKLAYFPQDWRKWSSWKIKNAPAWVSTDWYDVDARVAPEDLAAWQEGLAAWRVSGDFPDSRLLSSAWRAALMERCKLAVHTTPSVVPYLNLMVGKHGARLKDTVPGAVKPAKFKTEKLGDGFVIEDDGERRFVGVTMEEFAHFLTSLSPDYPVQDMTGLRGRYDFTLPWYDNEHYSDNEFSNPLDRMPLKGIGLILKPGKGPAYVVNIDHIERPDLN